MDREPCPWRIVDDAGGAFAFGLVGGTIWHTVGGLRNAPKGHRMKQAFARVKARTPILGGSFAIWGTLFSCFDCTITHIRKKEDPWNAIMSGAATGGVLAIRAGLRSAGKNALVGGLILAAIEGLNIAVSRIVMPMMEEKAISEGKVIDRLEPPTDPLRSHLRISRNASLNNSRNNSNIKDKSGFYGSGDDHIGATVWNPEAIAVKSNSGFELDSLPQFDASTDEWEKKMQLEAAEKAEDKSTEKPFWKVW